MRIGSKIVHLISSLYVLLALTACVEEELRQPMLGKGEGYLTLQVGPISAEVQAAPLTKATTTLEAEEIPAVTALTINVTSDGTQVSGFPKSYAELSAPIVLPTGTYTIEAYYGENKTLDTKPYFYDSREFTINALQSTSVELAPSLSNAMLKPIVDADLQKHYSKWTLSVKVGSITETLASNESKRNLYVHKEEAVAVSFTGTNLIGGETSKEATVTNSAAAGTQYVIQCNPENLPSFDLRTQATAEHTKVGELLSGTKVMINVASLTGTPAALITDWKAELQNQAGTVVRTFTGSGAPTQNSPAEMTQAGDWPYLPQGTYTLRSSLTLKTGELTAENVSTVEVPAPTFTVSASAYTSYNKYLAGEIDAANSCDGSTIYGMKAAPSITDALQNNPNYTQSSALTLDGNAVSAGNAESQSWAAHTLNASYTFDGVTMNGSETYHVTGLPYKGDYSSNSPVFGNGEIDKWIRVGESEGNKGSCGYILFKYYFSDISSNCHVFSPAFQLPNAVNIKYTTKVAYFTWGRWDPTIDVYVGITSDITTQPHDKTTSIKRIRTDSNPSDQKFTIIEETTKLEKNYRICISHNKQVDSNWADVWLTFKNLEVLYK